MSKEVYEKHNIEFYTTQDIGSKVGIIERTIRTIKERLFKIMASQESWQWTKHLDRIIDVYNKTYNRNLGFTPNEAAKKENQAEVFFNTVSKAEIRNLEKNLKYLFKPGDIVRVIKEQPHQKSYAGTFSDVLFKIYKRKRLAGVPLYYLEEYLSRTPVKGGFYTSEIQRARPNLKKIAKIDKLYSIRVSPEGEEQAKVRMKGEKKIQWVKYRNLFNS